MWRRLRDTGNGAAEPAARGGRRARLEFQQRHPVEERLQIPHAAHDDRLPGVHRRGVEPAIREQVLRQGRGQAAQELELLLADPHRRRRLEPERVPLRALGGELPHQELPQARARLPVNQPVRVTRLVASQRQQVVAGARPRHALAVRLAQRRGRPQEAVFHRGRPDDHLAPQPGAMALAQKAKREQRPHAGQFHAHDAAARRREQPVEPESGRPDPAGRANAAWCAR